MIRSLLPRFFSFVSAHKTGTPHDAVKHRKLGQDLRSYGFKPVAIDGHWGEPEKSYLIEHDGSPEAYKKIEEIGFNPYYGQDAVLHSQDHGDYNRLVNSDGRVQIGSGFIHDHPDLTDHYSILPGIGKIRLKIDFKKEENKPEEVKKSLLDNKKIQEIEAQHLAQAKARKPHHYGLVDGVNFFHAHVPEHDSLFGTHLKNVSDEEIYEAIEQSKKDGKPIIVHGEIPSSLKDKGWQASHPHSYDWHDPHTYYYKDLNKTEVESSTNHGNEQAAPKGVATYHPIASKFGTITPGKKTHLAFYPKLNEVEDKIDGLVKQHGFQTYIAGGKYGKPDLENKNYNTGHLMIYDPTPQSGGDFGHESYTRAWRKSHELAHALTYGDLNKIYGEGRRMGKLGTRTPREAKRAIHWEWLTAHKQRDLLGQAGIKISDEDFAKELNTVMHDALHRAVTGKFTEPSDEGFDPSSKIVPLEDIFQHFKEHQDRLGLKHDEATLYPKSSDYLKKIDEKERESMADKKKNIEIPAKDLVDEHKKLIEILESPSHQDDLEEAKEQRKELAQYQEQMKQKPEVLDKINALKARLQETKETLTAKDLVAGIENPEKECAACERPAEKCICYFNLPSPRIEFDGKKLSIFFKSEWHEEDRLNFMNDLKRRAGRILLEQRKEKAESTLAEIKKKLE